MGDMADYAYDQALDAALEDGTFEAWFRNKRKPRCRYCGATNVFWQFVQSSNGPPEEGRWRLANRPGKGFHLCAEYWQANREHQAKVNRRRYEEEIRRTALAKLTPEEIKVLGLDKPKESEYLPPPAGLLDNSEHAAGGHYGQGGLGDEDRAPYCDDWMWK